jgi:hypothetical protein
MEVNNNSAPSSRGLRARGRCGWVSLRTRPRPGERQGAKLLRRPKRSGKVFSRLTEDLPPRGELREAWGEQQERRKQQYCQQQPWRGPDPAPRDLDPYAEPRPEVRLTRRPRPPEPAPAEDDGGWEGGEENDAGDGLPERILALNRALGSGRVGAAGGEPTTATGLLASAEGHLDRLHQVPPAACEPYSLIRSRVPWWL